MHGKLNVFFDGFAIIGTSIMHIRRTTRVILELAEKSKMAAKMAAFHHEIVTF